MEDAIAQGFLVERGEELLLPLKKLSEVNGGASVSNLETGETYDPDEFELSMAVDYCPFCGSWLGRTQADVEDDEG